MITIIIPSRNEKFLTKTVDDLLLKAEGDIEVYCVMDGYWDSPIDDKRVHVIHRGKAMGMRAAINAGVELAKGEFILKCDGHVMFDQGFDVKLAADCEDEMIMIPRRKRLDAVNWCIKDVGKIDVDYELLSYPDDPRDFGGPSLTGKIWEARARERADILIDDTPASQGSCWFMKKAYFKKLNLMDEESFGPFWNESQELALRSVLTGGRYVVNKKTWYAHLHKGKEHGRGYHLDTSWLTKGRNNTMRFFMGEKVWEDQKYPLSYLIEKFMPMPTWDEKKLKELKQREQWGRNALAKLFKGTGVEVGVERGMFSEVIMQYADKLYGVDPLKAYKGYREHVTQEKLDGFYNEVIEKFKGKNFEFIREFSIDASKRFEDESLDFVYIDGNHSYENVKADIEAWYPKVKKGGILAGHDYINKKNMDFGVKQAVQERFKDFTIWKDKSSSWSIIK